MDWWWQEFKGARRVIIIVIGTINTRAAAKRVNFGDATTNLHGITIEDTTFRHQPYTCVHSTISSTSVAESINRNRPCIYIYMYTHTHLIPSRRTGEKLSFPKTTTILLRVGRTVYIYRVIPLPA